MTGCLICLGPEPEQDGYHRRCLGDLFGAPCLPQTTLDREGFTRQAEQVLGKMSVAGAQPKLSLQRTPDGRALQVVERGGHFLIKPQTQSFPFVPENEHLSMRLAMLTGVRVARCGLIRLRDGSLAYLTRRFDRTLDVPPGKLLLNDFCQLAGLPPEARARGSAEDCARIVRRHAAEPEGAARELFLRFVLSYFIGNGDLHLKNLALLGGLDGRYEMSPAYDLVCTALYRDRSQTLPVSGFTQRLRRSHFIQFAQDACLIPQAEAGSLIDRLLSATEAAKELIGRSLLPAGAKPNYRRLLDKRRRALSCPGSGSVA